MLSEPDVDRRDGGVPDLAEITLRADYARERACQDGIAMVLVFLGRLCNRAAAGSHWSSGDSPPGAPTRQPGAGLASPPDAASPAPDAERWQHPSASGPRFKKTERNSR
jgi:hypothetical protein